MAGGERTVTAWERPTVPQPGDVGLTRGTGLVAWAIRWAESRRYGRGSPEAQWNHAFMVTGYSGAIVEATGKGVLYGWVASYEPGDFLLLRPTYADDGDRERAVSEMVGMVGKHYGFLIIVSQALAFMTQTRLRFGVSDTYVCSGAVAHAVDAGGVDCGPDSDWSSPADLLRVAEGTIATGGV